MGKLAHLKDREDSESRYKALRKAVESLKDEFSALDSALQGVNQVIVDSESRIKGSIPRVEIPKYDIELKSLSTQIDAVKESIGSIRFPEIPPYPEMKETDLSGVMRQLAALHDSVTNIEMPVFPEIEIPEPPKREWEFDVQRNVGGFIEKVLVKEI